MVNPDSIATRQHFSMFYNMGYSETLTTWIMDHFHVPIMADSMLSCIGMFHTTNIIVTHPLKFVFVGSIPESISAFLPSSGPRELTADMVKSIEGTDKPTKRGKNHK
uniref:Uncharacterized protein n=1 Tax=Lactuca sativa TaxID=4236 RepID=A0A9R1UG66_LACSA|nr:hypothetical protein LSAT_V11C900487930 [Lactuca sativa]